MRWKLWLGVTVVALAMAGCDDGGPSGGTDSGPPRDDAGTRDAGRPDTGANDGGQVVDGGPTCVDNDSDGYGEGCALGPDCNDEASAVSPAASESCNGIDDNCNGETDEEVGAPSCELSDGVCAGATQRCGPDGFIACEVSDYGASYEENETTCDGLDNDCDGSTDEGCPCTEGATQACGSDAGVCEAGTQTCTGGVWGPCDGQVSPMGEICDGLDNDCDGLEDEATDLTPQPCALQLGVCAGSRRTCDGVWVTCSGTASYGGNYEPTETRCDGLDNDCDGVTDEGCECLDGATQACGSEIGLCAQGTQICVAGGWGACAGEVTPVEEICNGADDDCDGDTDEDVVGPACALTVGVCASARQTCGGASGFMECTPARYGSAYEVTETRCDGLDNDCDGMTDEGCDCVDGQTQPCGTSTGACERGTQTCSGGAWGACTGGVGPAPEICNGLDDDCNNSSDDALTLPPCALQEGVCAGSRQTCGGTAGLVECAGTDSYGPNYLEVEDGSIDESQCDGLDNDCNGVVDDNCRSGPLVPGPEDAIVPDIYHRSIAYSVNFDGNWDIVFQNLDRGGPRRITTTPEDEIGVKISGNHLAFIRGEGAAARVVLYDLETDTETVLSTRETLSFDIGTSWVVWDEYDGAQYDVITYDLEDETRLTVGGPATDEFAPTVRGGVLAYLGTSSGNFLVHLAQYDFEAGDWGAPIVQTPAVFGIQTNPVLDFIAVAWTDSRAVSPPPTEIDPTDDWDVYVAGLVPFGSFATFPGENLADPATGTQWARNLDSGILLWEDFRNGNWDIGGAYLGGPGSLITSSSALQAGPANSGAHLVWYDNRLGTFDIYQSFLTGNSPPEAGWVQITEILADPGSINDANGDGVPDSTQDEFVELINYTAFPIDISGMTLSDAASVRHVFPPGTVLPALGVAVVFSGGTPTGNFGGAWVEVASEGLLSLNNSNETLTLTAADGTPIDTVTYGGVADNDESIVRDGEDFVRHSMVPGARGRFSPGTYAQGVVP